MTDPLYFDDLETRPASVREADLMARLPAQVAHAQASSPAYRRLLQGVEAHAIASRAALAQLPVTRKHALLERQQAGRTGAAAADATVSERVFGGFAAHGYGPRMPRVFASPGPIYEPDGASHDWRMARAMHAAGFRAGQLVHNSFSYHLVPAGAMMESGARRLGCSVFPGGTGQTELQLQAIADLRPQAYVGTPSFLRILLEKAAAQQQRPPSLTHALVSGEACPPSLQAWFAGQGVEALQCYATAELGLIAYETSARQGLVVDEEVIVEIVRPGTGQPVAEGDVGEVVVTTFNPDYPLIRFGTGDLSAVWPGCCPTGRTNVRLKGWMGRADQTTKVRGMFIHPAQVADIARRLPQSPRLRLLVRGEQARDELVLQIELGQPDEALLALAATVVREVTRLRATVEPVAIASLPADGPSICDQRDYS